MRRKVNTHGLIITACRTRLPNLLRRKPSFAACAVAATAFSNSKIYRPDEQRGPIRHEHCRRLTRNSIAAALTMLELAAAKTRRLTST